MKSYLQGFPGQVGLVDLAQANLSLNLFHTWQEQTWGKEALKTSKQNAHVNNI